MTRRPPLFSLSILLTVGLAGCAQVSRLSLPKVQSQNKPAPTDPGTLDPDPVIVPTGKTIAAGPTDFCAKINAAQPGDMVVLASGTYNTVCRIDASGAAGKPIIISSENPLEAQRAKIVDGNHGDNLINVYASHLVFRNLFFGPSAYGIDALKLHEGVSDVTVEGCIFDGISGGSVNAPSVNTSAITVRRNVFRNLGATGIYLGVQEGTTVSRGARILNNCVRHVTSPAVGYWLEVKLNSDAVIAGNDVAFSQGPGIMVYGFDATAPGFTNVISNNVVRGSATDAGINVGGGPAEVANNVLIANKLAGIYAQNYASRGLLHDVHLVNNTSLNNLGTAEIKLEWGGTTNVLAYNATYNTAGAAAISPVSPSGTLRGNVNCARASDCFVSLATSMASNLTPVTGGLLDMSYTAADTWRPAIDLFGTTRSTQSQAGAIQRDPSTSTRLVVDTGACGDPTITP